MGAKNVTNAKKVKVRTKSKGSSGAVPMSRSSIDYLRNFINNGGTITLAFTTGSDDVVHEKTLSWNTVKSLQTAMPTLFNGVRTPIDTYNKKQVAA